MTDLTDGPGRPIGKVRAGMRVVDAEGETVGTVSHVTVGDQPADDDAQSRRHDAGAVVGGSVDNAPDVVDGQADRLMSDGYMKVLGTGVHGVDRYIAADEISEVDNRTVVLKVGRHELMADQ